MQRSRTAVEPAIEEYRVEMAHGRADLEAVDDPAQARGCHDKAGLLAHLPCDVLGGRFADVAKAGRIPPASAGPLNQENLVALVEDDRTASDPHRNVAVIAT